MFTTTPLIGALRPGIVCYADDSVLTGGAASADPPTADPTPVVDPPKVDDRNERDEAFAAMRRQLKAEQKAREAAEAKVAERDRKDAEAQGKWQELAEAADKRAKELEAKIAEGYRHQLVTSVAQRLEFANPSIAFRLIDADDMADEKLIEAALKRLAKTEPYLLKPAPTRTGREVGGGPDTENTDPERLQGQDILSILGRGG